MQPTAEHCHYHWHLMRGVAGSRGLASKIGGKWDWWEVDSHNWWEVGPKERWEMGGWPPKQVGDGRLRSMPHPLFSDMSLGKSQ